MTPYHQFVAELARLAHAGKQFPLGGFPKPARPPLPADAPRALIFSPHPDDECIIGALALRLQREAGFADRQRRGHAGQQQGAPGGAVGGAARRVRLPRFRARRDDSRRAREGERRQPQRRSGSLAGVGRRDRANPRQPPARGRVLPARCRLEQLAHRHALPGRGRARAAGAGVHVHESPRRNSGARWRRPT